jgi:uncharacterized protein (TIGR02271 family)
MARNTVVGVFDNYAEAERAVTALANAGIDRDVIHTSANEGTSALATHETAAEATSHSHDGEGLGERIRHFFGSLFGGDDDEDTTYYSEAVRRGSVIVTVDSDSADQADRAADVLNECGAVDVDARATEWRQGGWAGSPPSARPVQDAATARETVIPVVKEELRVGTRRRERGGVRIYTHMEEAPVQERVTLHDERAVVERRTVDRPATEADFAAFKEGTIEVRETIEEPVVAKAARVVEEVVVGKEVSERTETVSDSVRRGEVDVQQLGGTAAGEATRARSDIDTPDDDASYRSHWQTNYATAGGRYEDYEPAYRYGSTLARDGRYRNRDWKDIEGDARRDWETRYPGSTWERIKAAARHGWERVTGRR